MKLSIIVTTYNSPDKLKKVLDGLFCQSVQPNEILIADDGSDERTRKIIEPYRVCKKISIIHVWHPDKGFRAAKIRNGAILQASYEYIVFLDGDCIPERHFVEDHLDMAEKGLFFQGKRVLVKQWLAERFTYLDVNSIGSILKYLCLAGLSNIHHIFRMPFFPSYIKHGLSGIKSCNLAVFKDDLVAVNGFDQSFVGWGKEDSELVVRLYKYGLMRKEHPFRAICYHLWHDQNERDALDRNERRLQQSIESDDYYCRTGMVMKNHFETNNM